MFSRVKTKSYHCLSGIGKWTNILAWPQLPALDLHVLPTSTDPQEPSSWMRLGPWAAAAPSMFTSRTPLSKRARMLFSSIPSGS